MSSKCKVCAGSVPNDQAHYGAIVCNSCRLFFRRFAHQKPACNSGFKSCSVMGQARTKCKSCRLQKCFEVGMDSQLVNKTKKAIAAYFAQEEAIAQPLGNDQPNPVNDSDPVVQFILEASVETSQEFGNYSESEEAIAQPLSNDIDHPNPVNDSDPVVQFILEASVETSNEFGNYSESEGSEESSKTINSDGIEEICSNINQELTSVEFPSDNLFSFNKFTISDLQYFQYSMGHARSFILGSMFILGNDPSSMNLLKDYVQEYSDTATKPANHVTPISKLLDMNNLVIPLFCKYVQDITHITDPKVVQNIAQIFKEETDVYNLFQSMFCDHKTPRENMAEFGITDEHLACVPIPFQNLLDFKHANAFTTASEFQSPWAASEDLENFFVATAQKFSFVSDPVSAAIFFQLLLLTSNTR